MIGVSTKSEPDGKLSTVLLEAWRQLLESVSRLTLDSDSKKQIDIVTCIGQKLLVCSQLSSQPTLNFKESIQSVPQSLKDPSSVVGSLIASIKQIKDKILLSDPQHGLVKCYYEIIERELLNFQIYSDLTETFKKLANITKEFHSLLPNPGQQELITIFRARFDSNKLQPRRQSAYQKVVSVVNKRFLTLDRLDLDYHSFRTYYFQSRRDKEELLNEFTKRNRLPCKTYAAFEKKYKLYELRSSNPHYSKKKSSRTLSLPTSMRPSTKGQSISPNIRRRTGYRLRQVSPIKVSPIQKMMTEREELQDLIQKQIDTENQIQHWRNVNKKIDTIELSTIHKEENEEKGEMFLGCYEGQPTLSPLTRGSPRKIYTPISILRRAEGSNSPTPLKNVKLADIDLTKKLFSDTSQEFNPGNSLASLVGPSSPSKLQEDRFTRIHKYLTGKATRAERKEITLVRRNSVASENSALVGKLFRSKSLRAND